MHAYVLDMGWRVVRPAVVLTIKGTTYSYRAALVPSSLSRGGWADLHFRYVDGALGGWLMQRRRLRG
eukprot:5183554-Amphidinium_carterae.1